MPTPAAETMASSARPLDPWLPRPHPRRSRDPLPARPRIGQWTAAFRWGDKWRFGALRGSPVHGLSDALCGRWKRRVACPAGGAGLERPGSPPCRPAVSSAGGRFARERWPAANVDRRCLELRLTAPSWFWAPLREGLADLCLHPARPANRRRGLADTTSPPASGRGFQSADDRVARTVARTGAGRAAACRDWLAPRLKKPPALPRLFMVRRAGGCPWLPNPRDESMKINDAVVPRRSRQTTKGRQSRQSKAKLSPANPDAWPFGLALQLVHPCRSDQVARARTRCAVFGPQPGGL